MIKKLVAWGNRALPEIEPVLSRFTRWEGQLFPEFQVLFHRGGRVAYLNLTRPRQLAFLSVILSVIGLTVYLGARFQHFGHVVASRGGALHDADRDKAFLVQQIAALQDALAEAEERAASIGEENDRLGTDLADAKKRIDQLDAERAQLMADRAQIEGQLAGAEDKLNSRSGNVAQLTKELEHDRDLLRHSDANQATLETRIQSLEQQLTRANSSTDQYKSDLANIERRLQELSVERDRLTSQQTGQRGKSRTADSKRQGASNETAGPADTAAISPAPGDDIEAWLASTGLDVGKLVNEIARSSPRGEGGPFIALNDPGKAEEQQTQRARILQRLIAILPLAAPLDSYHFESPFGPRVDPINHREGFHTGVDLSAPYRTHVFSTAPGIVVFAGADGEYGRLVEIDHGHGIVTRYAHLHRTFVVKGQKVAAHTAIGELGSTGRSTGPHVHYEVVVDGTPVDPAKFIGAGRNVVQAGAR